MDADNNRFSEEDKNPCFTRNVTGTDYQIYIICLCLLWGSKKDNFYVLTEVKNTGKFDDVVFSYTEQEREIFTFIQVKHRDTQCGSDVITPMDLLNKTESKSHKSFYLGSYLDSFIKVKGNQKFHNAELKRFILFTTMGLEFTDLTKSSQNPTMKPTRVKNRDIILSFTRVSKKNFPLVSLFVNHRTGKKFKCFKLMYKSDLDIVFDNRKSSDIKDFLEVFYLCVEQPKEPELYDIIAGEISRKYDKDISVEGTNELLKRLRDWVKSSEFKFTKQQVMDVLQAKLEDFSRRYLTQLTDSYCHAINPNRIAFATTSERLDKFLSDGRSGILNISCSRDIWLTLLRTQKSVCECKINYCILGLSLLNEERNKHVLRIMSSSKSFLFMIFCDCESITEEAKAFLRYIMQNIKTKEPPEQNAVHEEIVKKVLIVSTEKFRKVLNIFQGIYQELKAEEINLNLLEPETQEMILEDEVDFQGVPLPLSRLIDKQNRHLIDESVLFRLIKQKEKIVIGKRLESIEKTEPCYINQRLIKYDVLNEEFVRTWKQGIVAASGDIEYIDHLARSCGKTLVWCSDVETVKNCSKQSEKFIFCLDHPRRQFGELCKLFMDKIVLWINCRKHCISLVKFNTHVEQVRKFVEKYQRTKLYIITEQEEINIAGPSSKHKVGKKEGNIFKKNVKEESEKRKDNLETNFASERDALVQALIRLMDRWLEFVESPLYSEERANQIMQFLFHGGLAVNTDLMKQLLETLLNSKERIIQITQDLHGGISGHMNLIKQLLEASLNSKEVINQIMDDLFHGRPSVHMDLLKQSVERFSNEIERINQIINDVFNGGLCAHMDLLNPSSESLNSFKDHDMMLCDVLKATGLTRGLFPIVISAKAGMGKSSLLGYLSYEIKQFNPDSWVLALNLNDLTKRPNILRNFRKHGNIVQFLIHFQNIDDRLSNNLLQHFYEHKQIAILVDAFDEIDEKYRETMLVILKELADQPSVMLWIATRPRYRNDIESTLGTLSVSIDYFTEEEQIRYLSNMFSRECSSYRAVAKNVASWTLKCIKILKISLCQQLIKVPLFLNMFFVLLSSNMKNSKPSHELDFISSLNICILYEFFIDEKYSILCQEKISMSKDNPNYETFLKIFVEDANKRHMHISIRTLFPRDHALQNMCKRFLGCKEQTDKDQDELCRIGLVFKTGKDLKFINLSFAEYFSALFLARILRNGNESEKSFMTDFINKVLIGENYFQIMEFLDIQICEKAVHKAAIFGSDISAIGDTKDFPRDCLHRTPLHLAVYHKNLLMTKFFVDALSPNLNPVDVFNRTPLYYAAKVGDVGACTLLRGKGADVTTDVYEVAETNEHIRECLDELKFWRRTQ